MEFVKRYWSQIRQQLGELDVRSRILIGSLLVILVLAGFLVVQYAATPEMVSITGFVGDEQGEAMSRLEDAGVRVRTRNGELEVPADRRRDALAVLANHQLLARDTADAYDDFLASQSLWQSNQQREVALDLARQNDLARTIRRMRGVRTASVVIARPRNEGFSRTHQRPSAAVTIGLERSSRMNRDFVKAVAGLVSGAVAEMRPIDVQVIDSSNNAAYTVESEDELLANRTLEQIAAMEKQYGERIGHALSYIRGVIIAVNVQPDTVYKQYEQDYDFREPDRASESTLREERENLQEGGEAGARANLGSEVPGAGGVGQRESKELSERTYQNALLQAYRKTFRSGGAARRISVSVNVPRGYFVNLFRAQNPDVEQPTDEQLEPLIETQLESIERQVRMLVETDENAGNVNVAMVPDDTVLPTRAEVQEAGGLSGVLDSEWARPVGLGLLALVSLALMFAMVRKATQQPPMPSAEELAGVPPTLSNEEDLIGEADEGDTSMAGLELDEEELRIRKIAAQIGDMINNNPTEAATIFGKWVRAER